MRAQFQPSHYVFRELVMGRTIDNAMERDGLYFFEEGSDSNKVGQRTSCLKIVSFPINNSEVYLLQFRLGYPNFSYLKRLYPALFIRKESSSFYCDICALAKHHKNKYPAQPYTPTSLFSLIHSGIWGLFRVYTLVGKRWFMTIIYNHTRVCWVFLLKEKHEGETIF